MPIKTEIYFSPTDDIQQVLWNNTTEIKRRTIGNNKKLDIRSLKKRSARKKMSINESTNRINQTQHPIWTNEKITIGNEISIKQTRFKSNQ